MRPPNPPIDDGPWGGRRDTQRPQPSGARGGASERAVRSHARARSRLRDRLVAGEDFGKHARKYSEDIGSALEGGDLGWTNPGQMVPEFEQVMNQTGAGEISAPFHTQFGWHVLQVEERRSEDLSDEMRRNQARNILYGQKYDEELNNWLQKIRDEAFVEIKI